MSLERNWGRASLAITLTTPAFDFFIQLNPARGKTKEKLEEENAKRSKSLDWPDWSSTGKVAENAWCVSNTRQRYEREEMTWPRTLTAVSSKFVTAGEGVRRHRDVLEDDTETSNPPDDYQTAEWLAWKWESVNAVGSNCRWKWQLCWQAGWYDRLHYSLKLLLHILPSKSHQWSSITIMT